MSTIKFFNPDTNQWEYLTTIMIGPTGPKGATGAQGQGLVIKGSLANSSLLPTSGNQPGDAYLIAGNLWVWNGSSWQNTGSVQGPTGPQGTQGFTGATGVQGPTGAPGTNGANGAVGSTGAQGYTGPTGPQGLTGPTGPQGDKGDTGNPGPVGDMGPTGPAGTSVTILGTLESEAELPVSGNTNGDGYLIDGELWVWSGTQWTNVGNIAGPTGATGAGATGATGPSGPSVYVSATTPPAPTGATDTMLWFDTDDETAITLPPGPTGATGAQGPTGPTSTVPGPTGPQGPQGPAGATGAVGATGPAGASNWGQISGVVSNQTDLVEYIAENAPTPISVTVTTANNAAAKVGYTADGTYVPAAGDVIEVNFVNGSNVSNPTLNIDGSGAVNIRLGQSNVNTLTMGLGTAANSNIKIRMWHDGTYWQLFGANDNTNTTYTGITGTSTTATTATATLTINRYHISNYASGRQELTLPTSAAYGSIIEVYGLSAGGYTIKAPAGDDILVGGSSLTEIQGEQYETIVLRNVVANTTWTVISDNGQSMVFNEHLTGTIDGTNKVFTISAQASNLILTKNGIVLRPGAGNDYAFAGNTITFTTAPANNSVLLATYTKSAPFKMFGSNSFITKEVPSGLINGTNAVFTTGQAYVGGTLQVYINGIRQGITHAVETTPASGVFTLDAAPLTGDNLEVSYQTSQSASYNADTVDNIHASTVATPNTLFPLGSNGKFPDSVLGSATTPPVKHVVGTAGEPAYQNGWQHYTGSWGPSYFVKTADNMVTVSIMTRSGSNNTTIFTLPAGFRPGAQISGAGRDAAGVVLVDISAGGSIMTEGATNSTWLAINMTFLAEQ